MQLKTFLGTYQYMAPEIYEEKAPYDYTVDIYSIGVLAYRMFFKDYPFKLDTVQERSDLLEFDCLSYPAPKRVVEFIHNCLIYDSQKRYTIEQLMKSKLISGPIEELYNDMESKEVVNKDLENPISLP